ncbi:MAG: glycosyltransferase [Oscillospiraceae bacterium]|nr:glycosyltransferase [Oscillospiraceae bacterium]
MRRKVLFLMESLGGGGAEKVLVDLVNALDPERFDITLLTVTDGGVWESTLHPAVRRRSMLSLAAHRAGGWRTAWYAARYQMIRALPAGLAHRLFVRGRYDTEIAFCEGMATRLISGAPRGRRKLAWAHANPEEHPHADRAYRSLAGQRAAYRRFDDICCVSESVREAFTRKIGCPARVQYNPIDGAEIRAKAGLPAERDFWPAGQGLRLIAVGRLAPVKGYGRLLEVVRRLRDEGLSCRACILGEGGERPALEALIRAAGLEGQAVLPGFLPNPYPVLRQADVFVCASHAEGFSTAAAEALALGVPIVTTDCSGMREVLGDADCGIVTEASADGLTDGLRRILTDPVLRDGLRTAAARRGETFSLEARIREIEEIIDTIHATNAAHTLG